MKRKKILVVINLFESARNFVGGQFKYLAHNGYDMHLICSPHPDLKRYAIENHIFAYPVLLNRQLTPRQDLKSILQIYKYIRKNKIDIVIGHQAKGRLLSTLASFFAQAPHTIIFAHGAIFETSRGFKRKLLVWENKLESALSEKVVCVSSYIRDLRIKNKIDSPKKQIILGAGTCGGIDTRIQFNPDLLDNEKLNRLKLSLGIKANDFIIGFVGRLVRDKGVVELVKSFELLKNKYKNKAIKLLIIGAPEQRNALPEDILNILKSSKDIIFTGFINHKEINYYYKTMDCLVLPSYREGFGLCNIEAQAMGIPVLTTHITGCRDSILDGITGNYINLDPEDIANKIEGLLLDDDKKKELGENGIKWVRTNFDHSQIWPHVKNLLDQLN